MATHSLHPPVHTHGLADNCQRCGEQAERPFEALDEPNLLALVERTRRWMADEDTDALARSKNEQKAMSAVEHALTCMAILGRVEAKAVLAEAGQALIEYALFISLIALIALGIGTWTGWF